MSETRLKIALICFDNPFLPPEEGGKRGMRTRIESLLYSNKYDVDIFLLNKKAEGMAQSYGELGEKAHAITQYVMDGGLHVLMPPFPICVNKRYVADCVSDLKGKHYDIAIYEGEQVSKYRMLSAVDADHHILYMHDIESTYRAEIAKSQSVLLHMANAMESKRFAWIENKIDQYFDRVWYVSKEECEEFSKQFMDPSKGIYIPFPALKIADKLAKGKIRHRMLYVGDLSIKHNYLSVEWFARDVLPFIKERCPDAELVVVGRISEEHAETLRKYGANVCGYVDDLQAAYDAAACIVAPVLFGAGVKVKTIDALAQGQIVITTSKGVEGTDLQNNRHLIVENEPKKLAEICSKIMLDRNAYAYLAEEGLKYIKQVHTISHQAALIDEEIERLVN